MKIYELYEKNLNLKDNIAIKFKGQEIKYGELPDFINSYASYFQSIGIKKDSKVIICMPNCPEFIFTYLGVTKAGGITIPLNLLLTMDEIQYVVSESSADTIVLHPVVLKKLNPAALKKLNLKNIVVLDDEKKSEILKYNDFSTVDINDDDVCTYLYTSGTTGKPKGAMLTHKNFVADVMAMDEISDLGPNDNFLCVLPLFHSFSWSVNVLLVFYLGSTVTLKDSFLPKDTLETLLNENITVFCGVPSIFAFLIRMVEKGQFKALRLAISGGAPLAPEILNGFQNKFNFPLVEGYGLSEAAPVALLNPLGQNDVRKPGSIGIPLPCNIAKIVDKDDNEVPNGEVGELVLKGDNIMVGYHNMPDETKETLRGGWLHTGDLAKRDDDGYYYIVDRIKDMIILSGFNVYPREVEEALLEHPAVQDAAVIGIGDKYKGEDIKAFIVLKEGQKADRKELQKFLRNKLSIYKIPKIFEFVNDLPKGPTGKVVKKNLK